MPDEYPIGIRITSEQPPIPVGTAVNLSGPNGHAELAPMLHPNHIGGEDAARHPTTVLFQGAPIGQQCRSPEARALTSAHECRATSKLLGARSRMLEVDKGNVDLDAFRRLI
jgi:hypothetical protein